MTKDITKYEKAMLLSEDPLAYAITMKQQKAADSKNITPRGLGALEALPLIISLPLRTKND